MDEILLSTEGLSKSFELGGGLFSKPSRMMAVREVDLSVRRGSVTGIVGESGCGKSTLARLLLRLIEPTGGLVRFDGTALPKLSRREMRLMRRRMAMVFQDPYSSLDPRFTIAECLREPFAVQGLAVPEGRIEALLQQVGLPLQMMNAYPHHLSGGQRQRVGIARALALSPQMIILDEPTASLDVSIQAQIISLLEALKAEFGLTYIFISHDLGLVRYFCDRIVVMYLGSIVEELPDPASEPRHPYTRALLDSNFVPDPVRRKEVVPLVGEIASPFNLPKGCAFALRCPRSSERCGGEIPSLETGPDGHRVACFHPL
jgi:oligopeptide/dipeptide ABC transporter ATP-binding protein